MLLPATLLTSAICVVAFELARITKSYDYRTFLKGILGSAWLLYEIGYLMAAAGAILFSTKGVVIKLAYAEGLDAETVIAVRMAFALPIYLAIAALAVVQRRQRGEALPDRHLIAKAAGVGVLGYWFASYTDFLGLQFISAQFERLIHPLTVMLALPLAMTGVNVGTLGHEYWDDTGGAGGGISSLSPIPSVGFARAGTSRRNAVLSPEIPFTAAIAARVPCPAPTGTSP